MSKAEITVEGFVANDLEIRDAGSHRVVEVTVAHTPRKLDKDSGQWVDAGDTLWVSAAFWNEHASTVLVSVEKGDLVSLSGSVEVEAFLKRDGQPGAKVKVSSPVLAKVVRRPKSGAVSAGGQIPDSWVSAAPVVDTDGGWGMPVSITDETPF